MKTETENPRGQFSDEQVADLKKAIADLAEAKRVSPDKLSPSEFIATDHDPFASQNDADDSPPLSRHFLWRNKWPLASGIVGIVGGFLLFALLT